MYLIYLIEIERKTLQLAMVSNLSYTSTQHLAKGRLLHLRRMNEKHNARFVMLVG